MTKAEYMQHLRKALEGYDREFAQEILENYEEHFEDGLKNGRTEEEICEELGKIENFLKDIEDMMGDKDIHTHEVDHYTVITGPKEEHSGIRKIELAMMSISVEVYPSQDDQLHVYLQSGKDLSKYLEESISGDCYYAREIVDKKHRNQRGTGILFFMGMSVSEDQTLVLEVPSKLDSVKIKTMSGDIKMDQIWSRALSLETMSGDIRQDQLYAEEAFVKTASGDIWWHNADGKNAVLQTTSGDIDWHEVSAQEAQLTTISGDVNLLTVNTQKMKVKTTSGDVELRSSEFKEFNAATTSGDMDGSFFAENISLQSISGDISMSIDRRGRELIAKTKSVSGECSVYGNSYCDGTPDPTRHIVGYFSTISGDIEVR